jgi:acetyl esterase
MIRTAMTFAILAIPAASPAQEMEAPAGKSYIYKESAGKKRGIEIYFPPNHDPKTAKVPGLVLFHGGGWTGGTLAQFRRACHYFASRGLVTATVEYRMLGKDEVRQLPQGESLKRVCVSDAKSAIRWFKEHAGELGVDPARIVSGGGSAGGHIAVLATRNPGLDDPKDNTKTDTSVVAYLLFNPAFTADDARDAQIDALKHLGKDLAPAAVFFGTNDTWKKGWDAVEKHLHGAGNTTTEVFLAEGQAHGFFNKDPWQTVTLVAADRFLVQRGLLKGEPTLPLPKTGEKLTTAKP